MVYLIFGIILLIAPFLLAGFFEDKNAIFAYILFYFFAFLAILGLITQFFGVFYYWAIVLSVLASEIIALFIFFKLKKKFSFKIDWVAVAVFCIALATLYQVHYNYTGKMSLATDRTVAYHDVKNMNYPYPYFSDEWYAVSLTEGAINNHSLPTTATISQKPFLNMELFFHSFTADIMLILHVDPLASYTIISLFFNCLLILLAYLFLRTSGIEKMTSAVASLFLLYITSAANLPGLWHFIPFSLGVIFLLLSFCFIASKKLLPAFFASVLGTIFYPPMFPFFLLSLLLFFIFENKEHIIKNKKIYIYAVFGAMVAGVAIFFILLTTPLSEFIRHSFSRIIFTSLSAPYIQQYFFYFIVPLPVILLLFFGLKDVFKKQKWLLASFILGIVYWISYSVTTQRFFIDYERIAILASILACLFAGFGIQKIEQYLPKNSIKWVKIAILAGFLVFIPFYTKSNTWQDLVLIHPKNGQKMYAKAPANNYLTQEDLKFFADIKGKRFLSLPWKGLVIGTATHNYPVVTKEGTMSLGKESSVGEFFNADCAKKSELAKKMNLDYIYLYEFNCPGFKKIVQSQEGLTLYEFSKN